MRRVLSICFITFLSFFLVSCGNPLDTTIDEINQRYADFNPMSEEDVRVRLKEPINTRRIDEFNYTAIWAVGYRDIEKLKEDIKNGVEVEGVFIIFNETIRKFQELNMETLEMEWHEKLVVDAVKAERRVINLEDLK